MGSQQNRDFFLNSKGILVEKKKKERRNVALQSCFEARASNGIEVTVKSPVNAIPFSGSNSQPIFDPCRDNSFVPQSINQLYKMKISYILN